MGACSFSNRVPKYGRTAAEAFRDTVADARYEYGHGGYTGTIAEKSGFRMITPATLTQKPDDFIESLLQSAFGERHIPGWNPFEDKWGDAGCLDDGDDWIFFGLASH